MVKKATKMSQHDSTTELMTVPTNEPVKPFDDMIRQAVESGNADVLHRLIDAQERVMDRQSRMEYDAAMVRMQTELANAKIHKTGLIEFEGKGKAGKDYSQRSPYAKLEDIDKVLRPIMHKHGFVVTYNTEGNAPIVVKCKITHSGGHSEVSSMALPLDTSGSKNNLQGAGSSISYGRRYTLAAMLNLITPNEDDDGNGGPITDEQAAQIKQGLKDSGLDTKKFLAAVKAENVEEIRLRDFARCMNSIDARKFRNMEEAKKKAGDNA